MQIINKNVLFCSLFLIMSMPLISQDWETIELGEGIKPVIEVGTDGVVHVAAVKESFAGWTAYMRVENGQVERQIVNEGYFYAPLDIALDKNNKPAIAIHDHDAGGNEGDEAVYLWVQDDIWDIEEVASSGHDGWDNGLSFDSNGNLHTSTTDGSAGIEYGYRSALGWTKEAIGTGGIMYRFSTSIVCDPNDKPAIAFYDPNSNSVKFATKASGTWQIFEVDQNGGQYASLAIDNNGQFHIAYLTDSNQGSGTIKVASGSGDNWTISTVDNLSNIGSRVRRIVAVDVDQSNGLHVAYSDTDFVKYAKQSGSTWDIEIVTDFSSIARELGSMTDLAIGPDGSAHIVYYTTQSVVMYASQSNIPVIDNDNDGFNSDVDCNDSDASINPDAMEIVNNDVDENCDGNVEVIDEDNDGFNSSVDCNDNDASINPDATEIPNNTIDENCDGIIAADADNDGFNSDIDCNDNDPTINPDATEVVNNNVDENCDGNIEIIDIDGDGFNSDIDCDDNNSAINPQASEIPNNDIDENCDGIVLIVDEDSDGFNSDEDCNDNDASINPNAVEIPNNEIDEDCDGTAQQMTSSNEISGQIVSPTGIGVASVIVSITTNPVRSTTTDEEGRFLFENVEETGIILDFSKDGNPLNGISALDLVQIKNHILGKTMFSTEFQRKAADTNGNGSISSVDLIQIQNVLIGFWTEFSTKKSWGFDPPQLEIDSNSELSGLQIVGFKLGDVSGNADPKN